MLQIGSFFFLFLERRLLNTVSVTLKQRRLHLGLVSLTMRNMPLQSPRPSLSNPPFPLTPPQGLPKLHSKLGPRPLLQWLPGLCPTLGSPQTCSWREPPNQHSSTSLFGFLPGADQSFESKHILTVFLPFRIPEQGPSQLAH